MGPVGHSVAALTALAGAPILAIAWLARPASRDSWSQRLGAAPETPPDAPAPLWVHGASVGEILAAGRLVDAWRARGGDVVTSTTTQTGRAVASAARPDVPAILAPLDHPWVVARALSRVRPCALVLVETELWPSWIRAARAREIPVVVVSGRISDRSFPRYQRLRRLLSGSMRRLSFVAARSAIDAERFEALGVPRDRIEVIGDLKREPVAEERPLNEGLSRLLGDCPLFVAGSVHPGEERASLEALAAAEEAGHAPALVVAPRHPQRFDECALVLRASGRRVVRRSEGAAAPLDAGDVLLLDSLGELGALWPRASVAFVGGSLVPVGGHNVLEPVQAGVAVIFGPFTENAREAAEHVLRIGRGTRVLDAPGLCTAVVRAFEAVGSDSAQAPSDSTLEDLDEGTTARTLALLDRLLAGPR